MLKLLTLTALSAIALSPLAQACPDINGEFATPHDASGSYSTVQINSRKNIANVMEYSIGDPNDFMLADGVEYPKSGNGETGTAKVTCGDNWFEFEAKINDGRHIVIHYTKLSETQIRLEATGNAEGIPSGVFTKL